MTKMESIDPAGTPKQHYIYAVFDDEDAYHRAEPALRAIGVEPEQLMKPHASTLEHPSTDAGVLAKVERFLKKSLGGESHMAEIYARYLQEGRIVVAAPVSDQDAAQEITRIITGQGGYEVTYFRTWGIQYMSPQENIDHGVPTHSGSNTDTDT
jgi:hypothetical protein